MTLSDRNDLEEHYLAQVRRVVPLNACPDCGYSREGLAEMHACPECGWLPEESLVVLYGDGNGRPTKWDWRWFVPFLSMPLLAPFAFGLVPWIRGYVPLPRAVVTFAMAGIIMTVVLLWYRGVRRETGAWLQLRISPRGYAIRIGRGPATWRPWKRGWLAVVGRTMLNKPRLRVGPAKGHFLLAAPVDIFLDQDEATCAAIRMLCQMWIGRKIESSSATEER
jgi:hypothetical protein